MRWCWCCVVLLCVWLGAIERDHLEHFSFGGSLRFCQSSDRRSFASDRKIDLGASREKLILKSSIPRARARPRPRLARAIAPETTAPTKHTTALQPTNTTLNNGTHQANRSQEHRKKARDDGYFAWLASSFSRRSTIDRSCIASRLDVRLANGRRRMPSLVVGGGVRARKPPSAPSSAC